MEAIEAMMTRRSIRKFTQEPVSEEQIKTILECAMMAPTARDFQPWQFVVIDKREALDEIPSFHQYAGMLKQAPLAVLVCGDASKEKEMSYVLQNCSAATQNILLAVHALGLGAVWLGIHPREPRMQGMRELLSLPENIVPVSLIAIGHPDEEKTEKSRYDEKKVVRNAWRI